MAEVEILVSDLRTRAPIGDAEVAVFLTPDRGDRGDEQRPEAVLLSGKSDSAGRCVLRGDLGSRERVRVKPVVRARGYEEWRGGEMRRSDPSIRMETANPTVSRDGSVRIVVALERGATIAGVVTDGGGRPVAGAEIGLVLSMPHGCMWPHAFRVSTSMAWPPPCHTDVRGRFEWLSFPIRYADRVRHGHFVLLIDHVGFTPAMIWNVETLPRSELGVIDVEVVLEEGRAIEVEVLKGDGRPAHGASVTLRAMHTPEQPVCIEFEKRALTDAAGRGTVRGLSLAAHRLEVEAPGCAPFLAKVDLSAGVAGPLRIRMEEGSDLEGQVLDREGKPISRAPLVALVRHHQGAWPGEVPSVVRRAETDANGNFRIAGLPNGGWVELRCAPFLVARLDLPSTPVTLRMPPFADLEILLVAEETGQAIGSHGVVIFRGPGFSSHMRPDHRGRLHRPRVPVGHYELWADVPGRAIARGEVDLAEGGLPGPLILRVPRGREVRGEVRGTDGAPIAGVEVLAYARGPGGIRKARTNASGAYGLAGLEPGASLVFSCTGFALQVRPMPSSADPGSPAVVDVTMGKGATVTGRVTRRDGNGVARAKVAIRSPDPGRPPFEFPTALTDDCGGFVLRHVPEGEFLVGTGTAESKIRSCDGAEFVVELKVG